MIDIKIAGLKTDMSNGVSVTKVLLIGIGIVKNKPLVIVLTNVLITGCSGVIN